jgi:hypothetical protein
LAKSGQVDVAQTGAGVAEGIAAPRPESSSATNPRTSGRAVSRNGRKATAVHSREGPPALPNDEYP